MKRAYWMFWFISLLFAVPVQAQEAQLMLRLSRDFGYSSGTGRIQGVFSVRVDSTQDLVRVTYYLDNEVLGVVSEPPFRLRFSTDDYPLGIHELRAVGETAAGELLTSNVIRVEFVSAEEGWETAARITVPLIVLVFLAIGVSFAVTLMQRKKQPALPPGAPREYGLAGGAICPKCKRPFARHFWSPNLLAGKLERCPHCGKWSVVRAEPLSALRAAEQMELEALQDGEKPLELSEEERLRKELDASRFEEL